MTYRTMPRRFPVYADHASARCFRCAGPLAAPQATGYPLGRGTWRAACAACTALHVGPWTYYDLIAERTDGQCPACANDRARAKTS